MALGGGTVTIKSGSTTITDLTYSGTLQIDGTTYYSYARGVAQAASALQGPRPEQAFLAVPAHPLQFDLLALHPDSPGSAT